MDGDLALAPEDRLSGLARIVLAGVVWGTIPLALRAADGDATVKVFYRVFFAALVVGAWMLLSGGWRELTVLGREKLRQVALQGVLLTVNWLLFLSAFEFTEVATVELLGYTGPVFVALLTPFVTGDRFDRRIVLPLALSLGGISVILLRHGFTLGTARQVLGAALAAASALTYAALLLRSKRLLRGISTGALMLAQYTIASVILLPLVIYAYTTGNGPTSAGAYGALAALGIVHTALAGLLFFSGLRRVRADHAGILMYAEPVSAVIFAALFLHEPLTASIFVGGMMVVAGGVIVARMEPMPGIETPEPIIDIGEA
ncbi:MAG: DMT family transporter [Coriobacteriia bacterium]|nr:DMT family transporter [Coriobacteriia bacterium]MBN2839784.1 DMT family transporter [Coriobacteriia bacterium]